MRTKIDRKRTMTAAATILDATRGMTAALIERAERETGSRMSAYERVAASVGMSASWIRKFVAGTGDAKCPSLIAGLNIISQYDALCRRIEASADLEKARADQLWRNMHALDASAAEMVARVAATTTGGAGAEGDEASK
jgi:hypothetical protein